MLEEDLSFMTERDINPDECNYLEDSKLPVIVLATNYKYNFKDKEKFKGIVHQTAGHMCHQHYMQGMILNSQKEIEEKIKFIDAYWLDSDCGMGRVSLEEILKYRSQLKELLEVDCNFSYADFEEGIYPVDCSSENLKKLVTDDFPENLDNLVNWESKTSRLLGIAGRWNLYILGRNCD